MFGQTVRTYRLRLGLSQEDLAQAAGVDVKTIGNIEAGRRKPRMSTLGLLADALHLDETERDHLRTLVAPDPPFRPVPVAAVPAQLPADVPGFTGRDAELDGLDGLLAGGDRTAVMISAISGTAGVGKTALAVHWAHRVADRFPDGQLYVDLRGFDPDGQVTSPAEAMRGFLDALGVHLDRIPPRPDAQAALYRSVLAGKRILILLDNARDSAHVRSLLPGTPTCLVLVTSRSQLTGLVTTGASPLALDILSHDESRQLLTRRLGGGRMAAEPEAAKTIIAACAGLPLALVIAAARARQTGFALTALAAELDHATGRLDALDTGETNTQICAVFSWSYRALTPPAARVFRLLGLHPGPDISVAATASLTAHTPPDARRFLAELTRASLLAEHTPGRYTLHDLLRAYATHLAHTEAGQDEREAATRRLLDHYTHTACAAAQRSDHDPGTLSLTPDPPSPGVCPEQLTDLPQALAWLSTERAVLLTALRHAHDKGFDRHSWLLAWAVRRFLDRQGRWQNLASAAQVALRSARRIGNPAAQAFAYRLLARANVQLGHFTETRTELRHALELYGQAGDVVGQGQTYNDAAMLCEREGRYEEALGHAQQALSLMRAAGHLNGQAVTLNSVGWFRSHLGDLEQGLADCRQSVGLFDQIEDRYGEAAAWDSIGFALSHLGRHTEAVDCYRRALAMSGELRDRPHQSEILTNLGDAYRRAGDDKAARHAWHQALAILTDLDRPEATSVRERLQALDDR